MSHEVESMMYAGRAPWHGLGTPVQTEVRATDAIKLAGLDWTVELQPIFAGTGLVQSLVERARATVRASDQKPLGIVGERYVPVQNADAFSFFDEIVGGGQAIYHTAGALDGGRRVWMLAKLPGEIRVANGADVTEKYLLLVNSHDGSMALRMLMTPIRVVCANTLNLALHREVGDGIAIRHTASATSRIGEARRALGLAHAYYADFAAEAQRLAATSYSDEAMKALAERLFPGSGEEPSTRTTNIRERLTELFTEGRGHEQIRGTAWAALNAVAEFVDHHRAMRTTDLPTGRERHMASAWLGSGVRLKRSAHETILGQLAM